MNRVTFNCRTQPLPELHPGDFFLNQRDGELYMLVLGPNDFRDGKFFMAINMRRGTSWLRMQASETAAVEGLTYVGPCRITIEEGRELINDNE